MAGEKKSKIYIYFVGQYKNNPKNILIFVSQYNKCIFLLGFELSEKCRRDKKHRKLSEKLSINMLVNQPIYLSAFRVC